MLTWKTIVPAGGGLPSDSGASVPVEPLTALASSPAGKHQPAVTTPGPGQASPRTAVVALGGHVIVGPGAAGAPAVRPEDIEDSLEGVVKALNKGYRLALTHGNGPQIGQALMRAEATAGASPPPPVSYLVADVAGGLGHLIGQALRNRLIARGVDRDVAALPTQVLVDENDPALDNPTKFVGPCFEAEAAESLALEHGWQVRYDSGRGWRRVVPSPRPAGIIELESIRRLFLSGTVVIALGGGGVPVCRRADGGFRSLDGVIDKDLASALLAMELGVQELHILTEVDQVYLDYLRPTQRGLDVLTLDQARQHLAQGQFPPGSMGPKIQAAVEFLEGGGTLVIITSAERYGRSLDGRAGTWIVKTN